MLGQELMGILYKGYEVPKAEGRYVDMGMSFKKNEMKSQGPMPHRRPKRKPGELMELVYKHVTNKWQSTGEIGSNVDAARESVRNCLENLTKLGRVQVIGNYKEKQYRRK